MLFIMTVIPETIFGSIVMLFNKPHFYEIIVKEVKNLVWLFSIFNVMFLMYFFKNNVLRELESFQYTIYGEGVCSHQQDSLENLLLINDKYLIVNAETLIYSNYEQTLSFLIQVNFQLGRKMGKLEKNSFCSFKYVNDLILLIDKIKGFEIAFESPEYGDGCVQIVPNENLLNKLEMVRFKLLLLYLNQFEKRNFYSKKRKVFNSP
jgi:hypothetical protein